MRGAWLSLLVAVLKGFDIRWLTALDRLIFCENKYVQYLTCLRLGLPTPTTVVVSDRALIPDSLGPVIVVKPLGPGWFLDEAGRGQVVYAAALPRTADELRSLHGAPFLVQQLVRAEAHLRVVTVGRKSWSCALAADGLPLDWRQADEAHGAFSPVSHPSIERMAVRLAAALELGYSSQDWIVDAEGHPHFVDLNPAGQWLFLPEAVSRDITLEIAKCVTGNL